MPLSNAQIDEVNAKLGKLPPSLLQAFHEAADQLPPSLTDAQLQLWLDYPSTHLALLEQALGMPISQQAEIL